ncbi:MAG: ABC transporter ATP-binding protein [Armatimonadetes bacterium]|nr:ABC transporter ATP-binding protein [Armatimonadota bacterium]
MGDVVLAEGLTKRYGGRAVVDGLELCVPEGCCYGLLGPNGAGKSTALKMLMGLICPDAGRSSLFGEDSQRLSPPTLARTAYLAENHPLYRWMTIRQMTSFARSFYPRWNDELVGAIYDHFGLNWGQRIGRLSNGQRAQVSLALAVATEPELLILDDPTLGLDPLVRRDFLESLVQIIAQPGRTIIFSSHILGDVERVVDRIGILVDGSLRVDRPLDDLKERLRRVILTFGAPPPKTPNWPELVSAHRGEDRLELVVDGWDESVHAAALVLAPATLQVVEMDLEEIFVAYVGGSRSALPAFGEG